MKWFNAVLRATILAGLAGFAYARWVRPWHLRWGATEEEAAGELPGDEYAPDPEIDATHAITIDAPPEAVWPWIVQIGADKAGFYSYSWIENLLGCGLENADRIVPEWQGLEVGDEIRLHPRIALKVRQLVPGETLVLERDWSFHLRPLDGGRSRLIVRNRGYFENPSPGGGEPVRFDLGPVGNLVYWRGIFEPGHFIMEQKMLTGIKRRAEREWRRSGGKHLVDDLAPEAQFRDEVSVDVAASGDNILRALKDVTLEEMPVARALGAVRYLPGKLLGRPAVGGGAGEPFLDVLRRGGTVVLAENPGEEIVFGGAGKYHQIVDQEPLPLASAEEFHAVDSPDFEKLVVAISAHPSGEKTTVTLEYRTTALSAESGRRFERYWLVIRPLGNFVSRQLLLAVKRRAERYEAAASRR